ncbi:MAG: hypothetical protein BWY70_01082 [Bacteroidetes bacterium ADurb.Bin408]|nr:MAG: hypothetical protein BWY70_01082 [Bacteroidetes bacterium ADurb.Bin408]
MFYERGWRGINIEPNCDLLQNFHKLRPDDINLGVGVFNVPGELIFYKFKEASLNTFDPIVGEDRIEKLDLFIEKVPVQVKRLDTILDEYANGREIDLLNIDVEGFDMEVLQSNNWDKYKPLIICVEDYIIDIDRYIEESEKHKFLKKIGYKLVSKVVDSLIYSRVHSKSLEDIKPRN